MDYNGNRFLICGKLAKQLGPEIKVHGGAK